MTIVAPGSKILVTGKLGTNDDCLGRYSPVIVGASGFLGTWIVKTLLEQGFSVRATVRSPPKAESLKKLFATYGDRLEFSYVTDIINDGAFDQALKGDIEGVIHCASPLPIEDPKADPSENTGPAVKGTISILKSAQASPSVKRVIITSSVASVRDRDRPAGYQYSEVSTLFSSSQEIDESLTDAHYW